MFDQRWSYIEHHLELMFEMVWSFYFDAPFLLLYYAFKWHGRGICLDVVVWLPGEK